MFRKLVVGFVGLAVALGSAQAEEKKKPRKTPATPPLKTFDNHLLPLRFEDKLNLSKEQKEQIAKLETEFQLKQREAADKVKDDMTRIREVMKKARQDNNQAAQRKAAEDLRALNKASRQLRTDFEGKVAALLNDTQKNDL